MAVLSRDALEQSPLADLHVLARELGIDGFRRLRKAELVDAILSQQSGEDTGVPPEADDDVGELVATVDAGDAPEEEESRPRRGRRGGRGRSRRSEETEAEVEDGVTDEDAVSSDEDAVSSDDDAVVVDDDEERPRSRRGRRGGRSRDRDGGRDRDRDREPEDDTGEGQVVEGTVELLGNGSGFLRVSPPDPSDDDVYVSAAQVRRCELVTGDTVAGPMRPPRRSERYPSLIRIDTINGRSADEVAEGTPFDDLPAAFPSERFALGSEDVTLKAIEWLTPIGRGSRATITGTSRAGKTEALRRLAAALQGLEGIEVTTALVGARPEEVAEWKAAGIDPVSTTTIAASPDAQAQAAERVVDTAKRIAARGGNAVVLLDTLTYLHPPAARRMLAAARNIVDGGSLTIIATADAPVGGETTVIALDPSLTNTGRFPALDLVSSGTLKVDLLVGEAGADAIAQARAAAFG